MKELKELGDPVPPPYDDGSWKVARAIVLALCGITIYRCIEGVIDDMQRACEAYAHAGSYAMFVLLWILTGFIILGALWGLVYLAIKYYATINELTDIRRDFDKTKEELWTITKRSFLKVEDEVRWQTNSVTDELKKKVEKFITPLGAMPAFLSHTRSPRHTNFVDPSVTLPKVYHYDEGKKWEHDEEDDEDDLEDDSPDPTDETNPY